MTSEETLSVMKNMYRAWHVGDPKEPRDCVAEQAHALMVEAADLLKITLNVDDLRDWKRWRTH